MGGFHFCPLCCCASPALCPSLEELWENQAPANPSWAANRSGCCCCLCRLRLSPPFLLAPLHPAGFSTYLLLPRLTWHAFSSPPPFCHISLPLHQLAFAKDATSQSIMLSLEFLQTAVISLCALQRCKACNSPLSCKIRILKGHPPSLQPSLLWYLFAA